VGKEVAPPKLVLAGLSKWFGGLRAVGACSFEIAPGTVVGLIGPNGSGKSTVFNLVTGLLRPDEGTILYDGERIDGLATHEIARRGVGRTFQSVKIFRDLPVRENLAIAAMGRGLRGWEPRADEWLARMGLTRLVDAPDFLLLDEPLAGVHPVIRRQIADTLSDLRARGRTLLIIEHHMPFVMGLCDKIVVMDHGEKIAEGPPEAIRADPRVIAALLGRAERGSDDARA